MRIGVFVTAATARPEYVEAVSGHVQIPLMAASILADAGHDVTLITTKPPGTDCLPYRLAGKVEVCFVPHATRPWPQSGVYPARAVRQTLDLWTLLRRKHFDAVHFFGGTATGLLLGTLKMMGVRATAVYSPIQRPPSRGSRLRLALTRRAFGRIDVILATAGHVSSAWASLTRRQDIRTLYPGIIKPLSPAANGAVKNSVLFWRNAGYDNGADLAIRSFRKLAPRFPHIRFVFAVRPHDRYEEELRQLSREFSNVNVYIYPYADGISLARLLHEALFVVQPFRRLSINPQLSILESLYAGVPVVATDIESNGEIIHHEENGLLIPAGSDASLSESVERLIRDTALLTRLTENARPMTESRWNWNSFSEKLLQVYNELR